MKKIIALVACLSLVASLAVGGSIAYLQDQDSAVNVMTLGKVKIKQHEYERVLDDEGKYEMVTSEKYGEGYKLQDFSQNKPLYPATGKITGWGEGVYFDQLGNGASGGQKVFAGLNNVQDKFVLVENTGKSDAYVRQYIALEMGSNTKDLLGISTGDFWAYENLGIIAVGDNNYEVFEAIYKGSDTRHKDGILPAGEYTYNSLGQIYLTNEATNEDVEALDGNGNGLYDILVLSQAVQAQGFENATAALEAAFPKGEGDAAKAKVAEWLGGVTPITTPEDLEKVFNNNASSDTYELTSDVLLQDMSLIHGQTATADYTVNGNGNTVTGIATSADAFQWEGGTIPAMSPIFSSANGSKVTVNNLTFTGTMSAVMAGNYKNATYNDFNTEFNNVNIVDAEVVSFSANISPALCIYGNAVLNNCTVKGTKLSALDTDPMWPVYDVAAVNYSNTTLNGGEYGTVYLWNQAKLTVDGAKVDTIVVRGNMNSTNSLIDIKTNTVKKIDLSGIADKNKAYNINLADGVNVKFVANGTEYDTLEAWRTAP